MRAFRRHNCRQADSSGRIRSPRSHVLAKLTFQTCGPKGRRRFLLHVLPRGFVRIRNFGYLANRRRSALLPLCFKVLGTHPPDVMSQTSTQKEPRPLWSCPKCGGSMVVIERLFASQTQLRSPPLLVTTAA